MVMVAGLGGVHADGVRQIGQQVGEHGVEADRVQHAGIRKLMIRAW